MSSFLERLNCSKGIGLNSILVDLFEIVEGNDKNKKEMINEYIAKKKMIEKLDPWQKSINKINKVISTMTQLDKNQKQIVIDFYLDCLKDGKINDVKALKTGLSRMGFEFEINKKIQLALRDMSFETTEGITLLDYEKVLKIYDYIIKQDIYDKIVIENEARFSRFVSMDGENFVTDNIEKIISFAEKHNKKIKLNGLISYKDYPINEFDKYNKTEIMHKLKKYIEEISIRYGNRINEIEIFEDLIYDYENTEFEFREIGASFRFRKKGWQEKLDLEDLCELAAFAKKRMPTVKFLYSECNLNNSKKRKDVIKLYEKIRKIEQRYHDNYQNQVQPNLSANLSLIDEISINEQLSIEDKVDDIDMAIEDIINKTGLPIQINNIDVVAISPDYCDLDLAIGKQNLIYNRLAKKIEENIINVSAISIGSISDELSNLNKKYSKCTYSSLMNKDIEPKDLSLYLDKMAEIEIKKKKSLKELFEKIRLRLTAPKVQMLGTRSEELPQLFNYHTHTSRCGHAIGSDEEYIINAINAGYKKLGFSDHIPRGKEEKNVRMSMNQMPEYIRKINRLKQQYKGKIDIYTGFEFEYYGDELEKTESVMEFRRYLKDNVDYLILGQHYIINNPKNLEDYPLAYATMVMQAMRSGLVSYIAHPDIFYRYRGTFSDEKNAIYEENCRKASDRICNLAKQLDIPLEINLARIEKATSGKSDSKYGLAKNGEYLYPVREFWQCAEKYSCRVLYGVDAHNPEALTKYDLYKEAIKVLDGLDLNYVSKDYVPKRISNVVDVLDNKNNNWLFFKNQLKSTRQLKGNN